MTNILALAAGTLGAAGIVGQNPEVAVGGLASLTALQLWTIAQLGTIRERLVRLEEPKERRGRDEG